MITQKILIDNFDNKAIRYGNTFRDYRVKTVAYQLTFALCLVAYIYVAAVRRYKANPYGHNINIYNRVPIIGELPLSKYILYLQRKRSKNDYCPSFLSVHNTLVHYYL